jgi:hypothetical protein
MKTLKTGFFYEFPPKVSGALVDYEIGLLSEVLFMSLFSHIQVTLDMLQKEALKI